MIRHLHGPMATIRVSSFLQHLFIINILRSDSPDRKGCATFVCSTGSSLNAILFTLIVAVGLIVRIGHWNLSPYSDECKYLSHAYYLATGIRPLWFDPAVAARVWFVAALAGWGSIVGFSTFRMQSIGLVWFIINSVLIYRITSKLYDSASARTAVLLYTFLPLDILHSTAALTDQPAVAVTLAVITIWLLEPKRQSMRVLRNASLGALLLVSIGVRQPLIFILIPIIAEVAFTEIRANRTVHFFFGTGTGFAAALGLQMFIHWLWLSDFWYAVRTNAQIVTTIEKGTSLLSGFGYLKLLLNSLSEYGAVGILLLVFAPACFTDRNDKTLLLGVAAAIYFLYHMAGTVSLRHWIVPWISPRYLIPAIVLGCILISRPLRTALVRLPLGSRVVAGLVLVASCLLGLKMINPPGVSELLWTLGHVRPKLRTCYLPQSVRLYFCPFDRSKYLNSFDVVDDQEIVTRVALNPEKPVVIPEAKYYRYRHVGVMAALESHCELWSKQPIYAPSWPPYWYLLTGRRDRIVGWLFVPRELPVSHIDDKETLE